MSKLIKTKIKNIKKKEKKKYLTVLDILRMLPLVGVEGHDPATLALILNALVTPLVGATFICPPSRFNVKWEPRPVVPKSSLTDDDALNGCNAFEMQKKKLKKKMKKKNEKIN